MRVGQWRLRGLVLALALADSHVLAQTEPSASGIYSCTDARGRKLTSDRPIAECLDREQKLLNPSGTVRARVGPTQTAQERADAEAREKAESETRALLLEEKRRERALLIRYPSRKVHDKERAEALAQVAAVVQTANQRVEELKRDRVKLDTEMEFYKKDPSRAPPALRRQMEDVAQSMAGQRRFLAEQEGEIRRVNARFDEELERLDPLWMAQARARPAAANAKK